MCAIAVYDNWHYTIVYPTKVNNCVLVVSKGTVEPRYNNIIWTMWITLL